MKKITYIAATMLAVTLASCSDEPAIEQRTGSSGLKNSPASTSAVTFTDESTFVSTLSTYGFKDPSQLSLNRIATTSGYNSVYGFNIPTANQVKGFKWNTGDQDTKDWRPQGVTGFTWGSKNYLLVTWYGVDPGTIAGVYNQHKGVRVSLVDITSMSNVTYRHILLVQNKANMTNPELYDVTNSYTQRDLYAPVTIHAGGIAYFNGKVYVADTSLGLRVFDLTKFVSAVADPSKETCGKDTDGTLKAFDYGYILPQTGYYKITGAAPFSCVETGEGATSADKRLWTGQYLSSGTPQVFGFPLNSSGQITGTPTAVTPKDNTSTAVYRTQGVFRKGTQTLLTTTGNSTYEGSTARLVRHNDGETAGLRFRWPHGAEDLYYESSAGLIWNLTEYETSKYGTQNRCVFAVRLTDYD